MLLTCIKRGGEYNLISKVLHYVTLLANNRISVIDHVVLTNVRILASACNRSMQKMEIETLLFSRKLGSPCKCA